jgi:uncharacterized membrane protein YdfJ with MMPL/SSD domain
VPGSRVTDFASTGNATFLTRDGRTTYALVFTSPGNPMAGAAQGQAPARALAAAGLGAGLAIDAIVIRCLMVPAMVALFGRFNWWLPAPLARVLRVKDGPVRPARPAAPAGEAAREPAAVLLNSR